MKIPNPSSSIGAFLLFATNLTAVAGDWPQFLGPQRNGISPETGLLTEWPAGGPKEVWRVQGGVGMSGLAISQGRLVTMVQREGNQWAVALDAGTGRTLWQTEVAREYRNQMGHGPRATPTIAGKRVFVFTGEGILAALNLDDGKVRWSRQALRELNGRPAEYGMACSPLVIDDQVIVTLGAPGGATVAAYDAVSGRPLWTAGNDAAGYSSPALLKAGGREQIVVHSGTAVLGLATKTGRQLWRHEYETPYDCNIATPIAVSDGILVSSGENHGSVLLSVSSSDEQIDVREVWASPGPTSVLRSEWQTPILLNGHLYGMDNVGGAGPITHLTCLEAKTGRRVWQQARFGKGNLIAAQGLLFISTMKGELVLVRATPKGFEELGRATVMKTTRTAPSLSNGRLYLRDDQEIVCLDARK